LSREEYIDAMNHYDTVLVASELASSIVDAFNLTRKIQGLHGSVKTGISSIKESIVDGLTGTVLDGDSDWITVSTTYCRYRTDTFIHAADDYILLVSTPYVIPSPYALSAYIATELDAPLVVHGVILDIELAHFMIHARRRRDEEPPQGLATILGNLVEILSSSLGYNVNPRQIIEFPLRIEFYTTSVQRDAVYLTNAGAAKYPLGRIYAYRTVECLDSGEVRRRWDVKKLYTGEELVKRVIEEIRSRG